MPTKQEDLAVLGRDDLLACVEAEGRTGAFPEGALEAAASIQCPNMEL